MVSTWQAIGMIAIVAGISFFLRAIPFMLFGGNRAVPRVIEYLGRMLPAAIMAALIVYCVRNVDLSVPYGGLAELISIVFVAVLHVWKRNNLLSIGLGTACYMVLVQLVF